MTLRYGLPRAEAIVRWADEVLQVLEEHVGDLSDPEGGDPHHGAADHLHAADQS
jgi:hypothetical protein